jgi:hypothetical protein
MGGKVLDILQELFSIGRKNMRNFLLDWEELRAF